MFGVVNKAGFYIVNLSKKHSPKMDWTQKLEFFYSCYSNISYWLLQLFKCCRWLLDLRKQTSWNNYTEFIIFFTVILVVF